MNESTKLMISDFAESCYAFNEIAGKDNDVSLNDLKKQLVLIYEEVDEISEGLVDNNPAEVLDGVIDTLVVTIGLLQKLENLGINVEEAMERTAANNLSKFTPSIEVAQQSVKALKANSINARTDYNAQYNVFVIKDSNDKVRKPWNFESNDLTCCIPEELKNGFKE